jgi:hypothetical protein
MDLSFPERKEVEETQYLDDIARELKNGNN